MLRLNKDRKSEINMEQEAVTPTATNEAANAAVLPDGADEMVATLSQNITEFYGMFIENLHKVVSREGLTLPDTIPSPEDLDGINIDQNPEDCERVMNAFTSAAEFAKQNGLTGRMTQKEANEFVRENVKEDTFEGVMLRKFAELKSSIEIGMSLRTHIFGFLDFKAKKEELLNPHYQKEEIIEKAGSAIEKAGFPVDGRKLVRNYLKAAETNAEEAFKILITVPATFAPIETKEVKKGLFHVNPDEGKRINKELASFLKKLEI